MSTIILIEPGADGSNEGTNQWQRELEDFDQFVIDHHQGVSVATADDDLIAELAQEFFDVSLDGETHVNRTPMGDIIVSKEYKYARSQG